jgi:molybdate transport system substrate-binding protein
MRLSAAALLCVLAWAGGGIRPALAQDRPALIAAAADLTFALAEVETAFTRATGFRLRVTYGSSGDLARQIAQGAPFELLLSADERYIFALRDQGLTRGEGAPYAVGRLALFTPHGSPIRLDAALEGLRTGVIGGRVVRLAIANPDHAPYGRAAQEVLTRLGIWDRVQPALVRGENASQAMQFAASGSCDGGLVPLALASASAAAARGSYQRVPADWHAPLRQRMVLTRTAGAAATAFYQFMQRGPGVRETLARYGFEPPAQDPAR